MCYFRAFQISRGRLPVSSATFFEPCAVYSVRSHTYLAPAAQPWILHNPLYIPTLLLVTGFADGNFLHFSLSRLLAFISLKASFHVSPFCPLLRCSLARGPWRIGTCVLFSAPFIFLLLRAVSSPSCYGFCRLVPNREQQRSGVVFLRLLRHASAHAQSGARQPSPPLATARAYARTLCRDRQTDTRAVGPCAGSVVARLAGTGLFGPAAAAIMVLRAPRCGSAPLWEEGSCPDSPRADGGADLS